MGTGAPGWVQVGRNQVWSLDAGRPARRRGPAGQCRPCTCVNITVNEAWKERGRMCPGVFFGGAGKVSFRLICLTYQRAGSRPAENRGLCLEDTDQPWCPF